MDEKLFDELAALDDPITALTEERYKAIVPAIKAAVNIILGFLVRFEALSEAERASLSQQLSDDIYGALAREGVPPDLVGGLLAASGVSERDRERLLSSASDAEIAPIVPIALHGVRVLTARNPQLAAQIIQRWAPKYLNQPAIRDAWQGVLNFKL